MEKENLCCFYASKYHLSIILLEYLRKNNPKKVETFLQHEVKDEIVAITNKYKYSKKITKEIDFEITKEVNQKEISKESEVYIVEGCINYIKEVDKYIYKNTANRSVTIINCVFFDCGEKEMSSFLRMCDKILYTSGEKIID